MSLRHLALVVTLAILVAHPGLAQRRSKSAVADSLERVVRADSNDAVLHYDLGMAYWKAKRWDDAERSLGAAIRLAPHYAEAYLALAALPPARGEKHWRRLEKEQGKEAVSAAFAAGAGHYRRAFLLNPLVDLGILGAVELRSSIRYGPYTISAWWMYFLAVSVNALRVGQYEAAYEGFQGLLDDARAGPDGLHLPEDVLWYHGLAAAHLGRFDVAVHDLAVLTGRAVADERDADLSAVPLRANDFRYVLATMLYLAGRYDEAVPTFRRALEFDIALFPAHVQLARMMEAEERWDEAVEERRAAVAVNPDDGKLWLDLGATLLRTGRTEEAREALDQAMAANPRDPAAAYLAGVAALRLDEVESARGSFARFLELAPSRYADQIAEVRAQLATLETSP